MGASQIMAMDMVPEDSRGTFLGDASALIADPSKAMDHF